MQAETRKRLTVTDGYLECPVCRKRHIQAVRPDTKAERLQVFCPKCKSEILVDMDKGQCFKSQGR